MSRRVSSSAIRCSTSKDCSWCVSILSRSVVNQTTIISEMAVSRRFVIFFSPFSCRTFISKNFISLYFFRVAFFCVRQSVANICMFQHRIALSAFTKYAAVGLFQSTTMLTRFWFFFLNFHPAWLLLLSNFDLCWWHDLINFSTPKIFQFAYRHRNGVTLLISWQKRGVGLSPNPHHLFFSRRCQCDIFWVACQLDETIFERFLSIREKYENSLCLTNN